MEGKFKVDQEEEKASIKPLATEAMSIQNVNHKYQLEEADISSN